jgi:hypothetical protein
LLVFSDSDMPAQIDRIRELGVSLSRNLPKVFDSTRNALIEAPEGTGLLLLSEED